MDSNDIHRKGFLSWSANSKMKTTRWSQAPQMWAGLLSASCPFISPVPGTRITYWINICWIHFTGLWNLKGWGESKPAARCKKSLLSPWTAWYPAPNRCPGIICSGHSCQGIPTYKSRQQPGWDAPGSAPLHKLHLGHFPTGTESVALGCTSKAKRTCVFRPPREGHCGFASLLDEEKRDTKKKQSREEPRTAKAAGTFRKDTKGIVTTNLKMSRSGGTF